jgi:hypothetical protein
MLGLVTQGGAIRSCRWLCPGLGSDRPRLGLYKEEAASCRFSKVQSPALLVQGGGTRTTSPWRLTEPPFVKGKFCRDNQQP